MQVAVKEKSGFTIVGIDMRTTNRNGESLRQIPAFWQKFYHDHVIQKIPSVINPNRVYAVYSDYDEQGYYSMLIGVEAKEQEQLPSGLVSMSVPSSKYAMLTAKGSIPYAISNTWDYVFSHEFPHTRAFRADFEVYDERSRAVRDAEVDLYISIF